MIIMFPPRLDFRGVDPFLTMIIVLVFSILLFILGMKIINMGIIK